MAEYIDREKAFEAVDKRVNELRGDKEFTLPKELCVRGVIKNLNDIPTADVVEWSKIDNAIEEIQRHMQELYTLDYEQLIEYVTYKDCLKILEKHIGGVEDASCN